MTGQTSKALLAEDIATALRTRRRGSAPELSTDPTGKLLLAAGVALAIMQIQPAQALTLGELRVNSALGEPFVGTTTARLAPGETLSSACIAAPRGGATGLSNPDDLQVSTVSAATPGEYTVELRTREPLYEPMYEIQLQLQCTGAVALTKSYVVMLNLPMRNPATAPATTRTNNPALTAARGTAASQPAPTRRAQPGAPRERSLGASAAPIPAGSSYRVRSGDTLSTIAERVAGRPVGSTWQVADMLFAANQRAFIRGDQNLLKLGYQLQIPGLSELQAGLLPEAPDQTDASSTPTQRPTQPNRTDSVAAVPATPGRPEEAGAVSAAPASSMLTNKVARTATGPLSETFADPFAADAATSAAARAVNDLAGATAATGADPALQATDLPTPEALARYSDAGANSTRAADTAATPTRAPAPIESESSASQADAGPLREQQNQGISPLVAILTGIAIGFGLALLLLGRNLLAPLLGRRSNAAESQAMRATAPVDDPDSSNDTQRLSVNEDNPFAYTRAGIDVELTPPMTPAEVEIEPATDEPVDVDLSAAGDAALDVDLSDAGLAEPTPTARNHAPRISLHNASNDFEDMLDTLAATEQFKMPSPADGPAASQEQNTDTMRQLFEDDSEPTDTFSAGEQLSSLEGPTEEMPELDPAAVEKDDLQSLSQLVSSEDNEHLTATLTQALDLLEQDYEDEMSSSQRLRKDEIQDAFAQHKKDEE